MVCLLVDDDVLVPCVLAGKSERENNRDASSKVSFTSRSKGSISPGSQNFFAPFPDFMNVRCSSTSQTLLPSYKEVRLGQIWALLFFVLSPPPFSQFYRKLQGKYSLSSSVLYLQQLSPGFLPKNLGMRESPSQHPSNILGGGLRGLGRG